MVKYYLDSTVCRMSYDMAEECRELANSKGRQMEEGNLK